ncbi:hypothetical protein ACIHCV_06235 [Streptomyces sp. NPDC051956]|uniref:hypothetical protein n=1 Tax=Streptomyces sp. NPDC051956 TaxID=3365677 RepID=UPI0037D7F0D1
MTVRCPEHETAVLNDTSVSSLGTLALRGVRTTEQVLLLTTSGGPASAWCAASRSNWPPPP